ncbi:MAG: tail fiber domain-containing protein, partial [Candidatus Sulfotelmatobacter sp.]
MLDTSLTFQSGIEFHANGARKFAIFTDTGGNSVNNLSIEDTSAGLTRFFINSVGRVGIGTTNPSNIFSIAQYTGSAIADGWSTYSSRRWKTNIHTLDGALAKVEQLRGVSYDLKGNGKHEVGVIAEEVGAVVPEVVTWEKNGQDAQGVDYGRLTALLIQATKEQQSLIRKQQAQLAAQQRQIEVARKRSDAQQARIGRL